MVALSIHVFLTKIIMVPLAKNRKAQEDSGLTLEDDEFDFRHVAYEAVTSLKIS